MARFLKNRKDTKGASPGSLIFIGKQKIEHPELKMIQYNSEGVKETLLKSFDKAEECINNEYISWFSLHGLHDTTLIEGMGKAFNIPSLYLEDILNTDQRPKYSEDNEHIYIILKSLVYNKEANQVQIDQISLIIGNHYLISIQEGNQKHFEDIYKRLIAPQSRMRTYASDYLCYAMIDTLVDSYILNIEALGSMIEEEEKTILTNQKGIIEHIYHYKTELSYIRKNIRPVKEIMTRFITSDSPLIKERTDLFLRDLDDLVTQVQEAIEIYHTMVSDQLNIYQTNTNNKVNDVMKVLTIFSAIFIPLTFIVGVYGMNFDNIPELKYTHAYFTLWAIMIIIVIVMLFFFKRKKWL